MFFTGGVPEWTIGAVSKTAVALGVTVGSNPTPSACTGFLSSPKGGETAAHIIPDSPHSLLL